jgi:hypothetical protein
MIAMLIHVSTSWRRWLFQTRCYLTLKVSLYRVDEKTLSSYGTTCSASLRIVRNGVLAWRNAQDTFESLLTLFDKEVKRHNRFLTSCLG